MDIEILPTTSLKDVRETNDFLRRIWARLRADFGMSFQFTPHLDKQNNVQNIGYISLHEVSKVLAGTNIREPASCFFRYKRRGVIDKFVFSLPTSWSSCPDIDDIERSIRSSLSKAMSDQPTETEVRLHILTPIPLDLPTISGEAFKFEGAKGKAGLSLTVRHYDDVDLEDQASNLAWSFCVLASAWTGHLFFLSRDQDNLTDYRSALSLISDGDLSGSLGMLADHSFAKMIDLLVSDSSHINPLLKAAHLIQRSIFSASSSLSLLGDTANALVISALEVLSDKGSKPLNCKSCGQPQFKISQRVRDYAAEHMGAERWEKWFGNKYAIRSKFLHTGVLRNKHLLVGKLNPTVQLSAPEGMAMPMSNSYDHVLTNVTLEIFRKHVQTISK